MVIKFYDWIGRSLMHASIVVSVWMIVDWIEALLGFHVAEKDWILVLLSAAAGSSVASIKP